MSSNLVDIYVLYRIIKDLATPFDKTDAFKTGLIDKKGERLRDSTGKKVKAETKAQKKADNYYFRFIRNLKRLMSKVGLGSRLATFAAAMFLIKEEMEKKHTLTEDGFKDEDLVLEEIVKGIRFLEKNSHKQYNQLCEEIANATGAAVAGTGDDPVHWKKMPYRVGSVGDRKRKGRYINGVAYLKAAAKAKKERESGRTKT
jgi:hypothetical protein